MAKKWKKVQTSPDLLQLEKAHLHAADKASGESVKSAARKTTRRSRSFLNKTAAESRLKQKPSIIQPVLEGVKNKRYDADNADNEFFGMQPIKEETSAPVNLEEESKEPKETSIHIIEMRD